MNEIQKRKCPYCGGMTPVGGNYCAVCHSFLGDTPTQQEPTQTQPKIEHDDFFDSEPQFCRSCGRKFDGNASYCPSCGQRTAARPAPSYAQETTPQKRKGPWEIFALLGFIFSFFEPLIGLIFCSISLKRDIRPSRHALAKAGLIISIISLALSVLLSILYHLLAFYFPNSILFEYLSNYFYYFYQYSLI